MIKSQTGETLLDQEILKRSVEGITDEQAGKVLELATNILSIKTGEIHGRYDQDFADMFGKAKPQGVKTYEWAKQEVTSLKEQLTKAGQGSAEAEALKARIKELEEKGSGDDALKQRAADLQARVDQLTQQTQTMTQQWEEKIRTEQQKAAALKVDFELQKALAGVKFKPSDLIPDPVRDTFVDNAKAKILNQYRPEFQDGKLIFRDANGMTINNPENAYNPMTARELLLKELTPIIDNGHQQQGAGTGPVAGAGGGQGAIHIGQAKTQSEAAEAIVQALMSQGLARGSNEFQAKLDEAWQANKVAELPIR